MANVLPPKTAKEIWRMYRARFVLAFSLTLMTLALLLQLALIPSILAIDFAAPPELPQPAHIGSGPSDAQAVQRAQQLLTRIAPLLSATGTPSVLLTAVMADTPAGVTIQHVTYAAPQSKIAGSLMLVGSASRENIEAMRNTLSKDTHFSSVAVPVSALVGSDAGHFSITLSIPAQ